MVRLREVPRTATFAWSPGPGKPFLITGTRAGAVDADFSDESKLELWDLSLEDLEQGIELQPTASISTDSRYLFMLPTADPDLCAYQNKGSTISRGDRHTPTIPGVLLLALSKMDHLSCGMQRS